MQFWSHRYTVVSYQALFRLSVYKIPAVYLSGAKNVRFCTIRDFGSPTKAEEEEGEICLSSVLGEAGSEMKNLKSEVISLKDEIIKMKAAKDRELGKQVEGRVKNAPMPDNIRNKSRENETDRSEIKIESKNGRLGAEMMNKKLIFYIGIKSEIKAIQIKENCEENQSKKSQARKDIRKEAGVILKKKDGIGKVNGTLCALLTREKT